MAHEVLTDPPASPVAGFVPEGIPQECLTDFDGGCLGDTLDTFVPVLELAADYLRARSAEQRYLICEDTLASKDDQFLARETVPFFTQDNDVYFFLRGGEVSADQVHNTMRAGGHYPWIAVLTSLPGGSPALRPHSEQPWGVLQALAHRTEHILVGAYDEEGWLVWSR
jgi:hypothetical protein